MTAPTFLSADHTGFYRDGLKFFPKIQEDLFPLKKASNAVLLALPASLKDDLDWSLEKKSAETIIEADKSIFFALDFQFRSQDFLCRDASIFFAHARVLEEFTKLYSTFSQKTLGVCLYRSMDFFSLFPYEDWEESFLEWLKELSESSYADHELRSLASLTSMVKQHYFHLFTANLFAAFLHKLISCLPDGMLPFVIFDASALSSPAFGAQLFSKERFKYLHLVLEGAEFPFTGLTMKTGHLANGWLGDCNAEIHSKDGLPSLGICFPCDTYCDRAILDKFDSLMLLLRAQFLIFRIIYEEALTEEWDGLDRLIIIPEAISPQGRRKLQGFVAAGGEIIEYPYDKII